MESLIVALSTTPSPEEADRLAQIAVNAGAVCSQRHGPLRSVYRWEGKVCVAEEWHLTIKFLQAQAESVRAAVLEAHPYAVPQWIELEVSHAAEKYLQWAQGER